MTTEFVLYEGRMVAKDNFRAFVYGLEGAQKLVNSWLEYEAAMASGLWFPSKDEIAADNERRKKEQLAAMEQKKINQMIHRNDVMKEKTTDDLEKNKRK